MYLAAAVLFVLVMLAGIMMIASSLNSNVAQRTEFFGLMRCIGATPKQVMRLVRKEALSWCRLAIPVGISIGVVVIWVLCAVLRFLSPEYFEAMPTFGFSLPSILSGVVVGLVTVLFAAYSPAKRQQKYLRWQRFPVMQMPWNLQETPLIHDCLRLIQHLEFITQKQIGKI